MKTIKFVEQVKNHFKFNIKFKDSSLLMKLIGKLLFFNKNFMTKYTTTLGNDIYFPNEAAYLQEKSIIIIAHELTHIEKNKDFIKTNFLYLFPASLVIFAPILFYISWFWGILFAIFCLLPWPAYWRMKMELEGYQMSLFILNELLKQLDIPESSRLFKLQEQAIFYSQEFTGLSYYLMWPFGVKKKMLEFCQKVTKEEIKDDIYMLMQKCIASTYDREKI